MPDECCCEFPEVCNGGGVLHCDGCGGDFCICTCGGDAECLGCGNCDGGVDEDDCG